MTNQEIIGILRERTARAMINYFLNQFGVMAFRHRGKSLTFSESDITMFVVNQIEDGTRLTESPEQAELMIIDLYSDILSEDSTGEQVKLSQVKLSEAGVRVVNQVFSDMVNESIEKGLI